LSKRRRKGIVAKGPVQIPESRQIKTTNGRTRQVGFRLWKDAMRLRAVEKEAGGEENGSLGRPLLADGGVPSNSRKVGGGTYDP